MALMLMMTMTMMMMVMIAFTGFKLSGLLWQCELSVTVLAILYNDNINVCNLFLLIQDMLEQIATCEKVFEVSKANKVNKTAIILTINEFFWSFVLWLPIFLIFKQVIVIIHIVASEGVQFFWPVLSLASSSSSPFHIWCSCYLPPTPFPVNPVPACLIWEASGWNVWKEP